MKLFRQHGKWVFILSPVLFFTGAVLEITWLINIGIGLLTALVLLLAIQLVIKRTIIQ